jgi:hypothetical protein
MGISSCVNNLRRPIAIWLPLFIALCVLACASPLHADPPARGKAFVAVNADISDPAGRDTISIRIVDNTDKAKLMDIVLALGVKMRTAPDDMKYAVGDPQYVEDSGIGLECTMPMVPRGDGYLPIAPFIETLAPYVSEVQILYIIQGPFTYRGIQRYEKNGVRVTVDPPESAPAGAPVQMAFYGMHATITDPTPGNVSIPHYSPQEGRARIWRILGWVLLAGLLGAGIGILVARLLMRWKAAAGLE